MDLQPSLEERCLLVCKLEEDGQGGIHTSNLREIVESNNKYIKESKSIDFVLPTSLYK